MTGRLFTGTSGFAYPDWAPTFYPAGLRRDGMLAAYAERLGACELNNTYYQHPKPDRIDRWLAQTPESFRFTVKAQRGGSLRALIADPVAAVPWLTEPYRRFGSRLGAVLYRIPPGVRRDDARLRDLLRTWPADVPLCLEFRDLSWYDDTVIRLVAEAGAAWCATDLDGLPEPSIHATGPFLYLRLRRPDPYPVAILERWLARLEPFRAQGLDAYVFLRHDENGVSALAAETLARLDGPSDPRDGGLASGA